MITTLEDLRPTSQRPDVCIVGAGAAGITLGRELARHGRQVLLLESGGRRHDSSTQALYDSEVVGLPHQGVHSYRFRQLGGSTTRWAGQAMPFLDVDFDRRSWVEGSGWPIDREALDSYYDRASVLLGIPAFGEGGVPSAALPELRGLDPALARPAWSVFSRTPDFAEQNLDALRGSAHITLALGANVTEILAGGGAVQAVRARSLSGASAVLEASCFVLCTGGIETARLMLCSNRDDGGLANEHDIVGRYFQDHPGLVVGVLHEASRGSIAALRPVRRGGHKYAVRLLAAPELQHREHLAHASVSATFDLNQPPSLIAAKALGTNVKERSFAGARRAARVVARQPAPVARAAMRYLAKRGALDTTVPPVIIAGGEQVPNPDSRILLSDECDLLGQPRTKLDWRLTVQDMRSMRIFAERMAIEMERAGIGSIDVADSFIPDDPAELGPLIADAGHHMGSTRMSQDPAAGVVNSDCRVHGLENLFIASCSVFPTGGAANPTFTLLALSLRLADRLAAGTR